MKTILIFIIIVTSSFNCSSQNFPPAGSIRHRPELDKFVGTWKWTDGGANELIIKTKKILSHYNMNGGFDDEELLVCHRYVQNGIVIEDNLSLFPSLDHYVSGVMVLSKLNPNELRGLVKDSLRNKYEKMRLAYNNVLPAPTLTWKLSNRESTYLPGVDPMPDNNTTLPKNLILIKQP